MLLSDKTYLTELAGWKVWGFKEGFFIAYLPRVS
jgi:hypothetical protein